MILKPLDRIGSADHYLPELNGATLQWWYFIASHGKFLLTASGLPRGLAEIRLSATEYINCPLRMCNVHLRVATEQETEALRRCVPEWQANHLEKEDHMVIECDEGTFSIWAGAIGVYWVDEPDRELVEAVSRPLWPGGPSLADM